MAAEPPGDPNSQIEPDLLVKAYRMGVFPMSMDDGQIGWFSPDPRAVIPLDDRFHIPHGLKRVLKKEPFEIRLDTAFEEVMRGCADREETWISEGIIRSYCQLHALGMAHSVESWQDGELVGGLYGVALGGAFFGESMFSRVSEASKVALVHLVRHLRNRKFLLLDTQWTTRHLARFGVKEIPRDDYLGLLEEALAVPVTW